MGEYAVRKSDRTEIKIGTCESMYYLRWDDRHKVKRLPHSLDPSDTPNLYWRLPVPDEDQILPGDYDTDWPCVTLGSYEDKEADKWIDYFPDGDVKSGTIQLYNDKCGLLVNVPCHHGVRLPDMGEGKAFFNGKARHWYELCGVKNHELSDGTIVLLPLVRCRFCGSMFRESWSGILLHIPEGPLRDRLVDYAAFNTMAIAA